MKKKRADNSILAGIEGLFIRVASAASGLPTAIANVQEFVNYSHKYTDSTGVQFAAEVISEFFGSIWNHREYIANLELAVNISWEEVNQKLPTEYNFKKKSFEYGAEAMTLQARIRYELAGSTDEVVRFASQSRRQYEIDRDLRDAGTLVSSYILRAESVVAATRRYWNRFFCPKSSRIQLEKAVQRLEQYRKVEHELKSIVMKHYDTTEDDFIASNKVNREIYAKLNATPGYTIGRQSTEASYLQRVEALTSQIATQVEAHKAFEMEVGNHVTLQTANYIYKGRPIHIKRLSSEMKKGISFAVQTQLAASYGKNADHTVLQRDVQRRAAVTLLRVVDEQVFAERREYFEKSIPGVHSMIGL